MCQSGKCSYEDRNGDCTFYRDCFEGEVCPCIEEMLLYADKVIKDDKE